MGIHEVKAESGKRKTEMRRAVFLDRDGVINRALEREASRIRREAWPNLKFSPRFPPRARNSKPPAFCSSW